MEEDKAERKRRLQRERSARYRARQNAETLERLRKENRERKALNLKCETPERRRARLNANATRNAARRKGETLKEALAGLDDEVIYGHAKTVHESESVTSQEEDDEVVHIKEERSDSPCLPSRSFGDHTTVGKQFKNCLQPSNALLAASPETLLLSTNSPNPVDCESELQGLPGFKMENESFDSLESIRGATVPTSSNVQSPRSSIRSFTKPEKKNLHKYKEENSVCDGNNDDINETDKYSRLIVIAPLNSPDELKDADYSSLLSPSGSLSSNQCNNFQSTFNSQSSFERQNASSPEIKIEPLEITENQIGRELMSNQSVQLPRPSLSASLTYPNCLADLCSITPKEMNQRSFMEIAFHHMLGIEEAQEEKKQRLTRERVAWWRANLDQETINQLWSESRERITKSELLGTEETREERKRRLTRERVARWRANLDKKTIDRLKSENRERIAKCRVKPETPEQRQARLDADAKRKAEYRRRETPEQRRARLDADARRMALRRLKLTPEELQARREENAKWVANRRRNETPEERHARLEANARWQANRRKNETPEQRQTRLEAAAKRIAIRRRRGRPGEAKPFLAGSESSFPPAKDHVSTKAHLKAGIFSDTACSTSVHKTSSSMVSGVQPNETRTEPIGFSGVEVENESSAFLESVCSDSVSAKSNVHSSNIEFLSEEEGGQLSTWGSPNLSAIKEQQRADKTVSTLFCLRENVLKLLKRVIPHSPVFLSGEQVPLESVDKILEELLANLNSSSEKISILDV